MSKIQIAPSILAANFLHLSTELQTLEDAGADIIHYDVMDGNFVSQITFGCLLLESIKQRTKLPLDVHLMVVHPEDKIKDFITAGANMLTFHIEAVDTVKDAIEILQTIQLNGAKAGIALNPKTPIETVYPLLPYCHHLLVMSVQAGYGGQQFIPYTLEKVAKAAEYIKNNHLATIIEMDGGIAIENAKEAIKAGVSILVAGSAIFKATDKKERIRQLRYGQ